MTDDDYMAWLVMGEATTWRHPPSRLVALQEDVGLVLSHPCRGRDDIAVITPCHEPGGSIRSDVVVVAHVAEGDDRILLRVGLHDREGHRTERYLACRRRADRGRSQAQVFLVGLDQVDRGAGHPLIPHGM